MHSSDSLYPIIIARSPKRRTLSMRWITDATHPDGAIQVHAPAHTPKRAIQQFINTQHSWILAQQKRHTQRTHARSQHILLQEGGHATLLGTQHRIHIDESSLLKKKGYCTSDGKQLWISIPQCHDAPSREQAIYTAFTHWVRETAYTHLEPLSHDYADLLGTKIGKIWVRDQKQRWGSCDRHDNLRYNWRIMLTDAGCLHYLAAHEVAHAIEKNHSQAFWQQVAIAVPDYKQHRARLRRYEWAFDL